MIVIGTRGSDLALTQSKYVAARLLELGVESRLEIIVTKGDVNQTLSLNKLEGKGFFTKELEEALLDGRVDLAVHSLKDLPTTSPKGLCIAAVTAREDPRDCLLVRPHAYDAAAQGLPLIQGATVGTSAVRRSAQLVFLRADLRPQNLRGNVPTRLLRLAEGRYDAIVLAQAGLRRLDSPLHDFVAVPLAADHFVPAPGQGALALQTRSEDTRCRDVVARLQDAAAALCIAAERGLLARLEGGCHLPLGAHAAFCQDHLALEVFMGETQQNKRPRRLRVTGQTPNDLVDTAYARLMSP